MGDSPRAAHIVGAQDAAPKCDPECVGGVRRIGAIRDLGAEQMSEEPLV
jgi:hypothetical protein